MVSLQGVVDELLGNLEVCLAQGGEAAGEIEVLGLRGKCDNSDGADGQEAVQAGFTASTTFIDEEGMCVQFAGERKGGMFTRIKRCGKADGGGRSRDAEPGGWGFGSC